MFGAPVQIGTGLVLGGDQLPDGRVLVGGTGLFTLTGAVLRPDGSTAASEGVQIAESRGQFPDVAVQGGDPVAMLEAPNGKPGPLFARRWTGNASMPQDGPAVRADRPALCTPQVH
jgi:hypothetical protein